MDTLVLPDTFRQLVRVACYCGSEEKEFISGYVNLNSENTLVVSTNKLMNVFDNSIEINAVVNLKRINDIRYINKFFNSVNANLKSGGTFIGCFETFTARRERMWINKIPLIGPLYFLIEFLALRAMPKLTGFKKIYFALTKGKGRLLSKAEVLGRAVCCGFEIIDYKTIDGLLYFVVRKVKEPVHDMSPSYGLLFKMQRTGKNGKMIGVYKFRTMHPYAEYLQDYVIRLNGYSEIGKPAHDFRLTSWGKFMRKYWLDELPQLINVLKGEMSLVGVRPISKRFLAEYPVELQEKRSRYKPGCVPPYVALLKQNVSEYLQAERTYLDEKEKHPFLTDVRYLVKAVGNIITNKIKSS